MTGGNLPAIAALVVQKYGVPFDQLITKSRGAERVFHRRVFCLAAHLAGYSYAQIARFIQRDHSTIIHAVRTARKQGDERRDAYEITQLLGTAVPDRKWELKPSGKYTRIYERHGGKCAVCSFDEVVEVHHIVPQRAGGTDDPENLILLCPNHHAMADRGMLFIKDINTPSTQSTCPQPSNSNSLIN